MNHDLLGNYTCIYILCSVYILDDDNHEISKNETTIDYIY